MDNQTPPVPPIPPAPVKGNDLFKILLIVIGVLVILGLFGNIYFLARNQKQVAETNPTPTLVPTVYTEDSRSANWKIYTNAKYSFSFKYPQETSLKNELDNTQVNQFLITFGNPDFTLDIYKITPDLNTNYYLDYAPSEIINIGAIAWKIFLATQGYCDGPSCSRPFVAYQTTNDGYRFVFEFKGRAEKELLHSQILSTFKFLDQNQAGATANWKTFQSSDLTFKYPAGWTKSGDFALVSADPKIRLVVIPKGNTLMNECMKETSVETRGTLTIKKFSRVTTGAMCETTDSTPREIWVIPSPDAYDPGISYEYLSTQGAQAESIFDQILSTFKFLQ